MQKIMRRACVAGAGLLLLLSAAGCGGPAQAEVAGVSAAAQATQRAYLAQLDSAIAAAGRLEQALATLETPAGVAEARQRFAAARDAYKHVELFVEYYAATAAKGINGAVLAEMEIDDPSKVVEPEGLQVLEESLFSEAPAAERAAMQAQAAIVQAHLRRVRRYAEGMLITDAAVFDAAKLELARLETLSLADFDSPVALRSFEEARAALAGVQAALAPFEATARRAAPKEWTQLAERFASADRALAAAAQARDTADRLALLVDQYEPLLHQLAATRSALDIPVPAEPRLWRVDAPSLFTPNAWNAQVLAPVDAPAVRDSAAAVALGGRLFSDPILSKDRDRSCASCHVPAMAFTDGRPRSLSRAGTTEQLRNAPTMYNAGLQGGYFADLRATYLEDQIVDVVGNAAEMHGDLSESAAALEADAAYRAAFRQVYGDSGVATPERIRTALARYVRSLERMNSRFDRYVRGDRSQLSAEERTGFNLFMGKGKCGTCHFMPLFNGTVPPGYTKMEAEVLGVPAVATEGRGRLDPDLGVYAVSRLPVQRYAFKTSTVRNVALTAPYFHNGAYRTLDEVVRFYDLGGGAGLGIDLEYQTLPGDPLKLTAAERAALVAFMQSLTDTTATRYPTTIAAAR